MWLSRCRQGSSLIESLQRPVDRLWKAARILRKVRPNFSPRCCGKGQAVEKGASLSLRQRPSKPPLRSLAPSVQAGHLSPFGGTAIFSSRARVTNSGCRGRRVDEQVARVFLEPEAASLLDEKVLDASVEQDQVAFTMADQVEE